MNDCELVSKLEALSSWVAARRGRSYFVNETMADDSGVPSVLAGVLDVADDAAGIISCVRVATQNAVVEDGVEVIRVQQGERPLDCLLYAFAEFVRRYQPD